MDWFPIRTTVLSEQETRLPSVCLIPQLIESSSMRTNTDSFNHRHTWSSFIIVLSSRSPPSGVLLFQCVGSAGSKKCQISIRIDSLLLSVTFERCFTRLELFLGERERWCATGGDSFSLHLYCSHTHTNTHPHFHTTVPLKIIWRFAVGGEAGTHSMTGPTPSGPRSCSA